MSKKSRRCRTTECSFCHDDEGITRMVGAQWRHGCTVCRCMKSGNVQCNKFCEYQLLQGNAFLWNNKGHSWLWKAIAGQMRSLLFQGGCPNNLTLVEPDDGCCYCTDSPLIPLLPDTAAVTTPTPNEGNIPVTCKEYQFGCRNRNQCIEYSGMCDGVPDCEDGSDEKYCDECLMPSWSDWSKESLRLSEKIIKLFDMLS